MSLTTLALSLGFQTSLRSLRPRVLATTAAISVALASIAALAERKASLTDAASRALHGPIFGLALPLATFALVASATSRTRLEQMLNPLAAMGVNRRIASVGAIASIAMLSALVSSLCAALAIVIANYGQNASTGMDIATCLSAAWLGAFAYSALFFFGSTWGAKGGGRSIALFLDLLAGSSASMAAIASPKAHTLNFLGAVPSIPIAQPASLAALASIGLIASALCAMRLKP